MALCFICCHHLALAALFRVIVYMSCSNFSHTQISHICVPYWDLKTFPDERYLQPFFRNQRGRLHLARHLHTYCRCFLYQLSNVTGKELWQHFWNIKKNPWNLMVEINWHGDSTLLFHKVICGVRCPVNSWKNPIWFLYNTETFLQEYQLRLFLKTDSSPSVQ